MVITNSDDHVHIHLILGDNKQKYLKNLTKVIKYDGRVNKQKKDTIHLVFQPHIINNIF